MKFSQLMKYNLFLGKSFTKYDGEKSPRPFLKKLRLSVDQQSGILYSLLLMYAQVENHQNILTLRC